MTGSTTRRQVLRGSVAFAATLLGSRHANADETAQRHLRGEALYRDVKHYCALGEHRTATPEDLKTADWLAEELKQAGLKTQQRPFNVPQFFLEDAKLEVAGQAVETFPFWPPKATGTTPVQGILVAARSGQTADLKGKVALLRFEVATRQDLARQIQAVANAGAVGAVMVCVTASGDLFGHGARQPLSIPVLLVGDKDEAALNEAATKGAAVSLLIEGKEEPQAHAREVVGQLERGKRLIVVSTPYSAWFTAGGERGPGIALWLGLARWAAARTTECSYVFVASSGHELAGAGIRHFMDHDAPKPEQVSCWLHLGASIAAYDWQRTPEGMKKFNRPYARKSLSTNRADLLPLIKSAFAPLGEWKPRQADDDPGELGLMFSKGYRAFGFSGGHPYFHSPRDTADCTGPELLEPIAAALAQVLTTVESEAS